MNKFAKKSLAIDSMVMIYLLEQNEKYINTIINLFHEFDTIIISTFLYAEVLTGYYRADEKEYGDTFLAFNEIGENIKICDFNLETAKRFADIRATYRNLKPPDCIHLATASANGASYLLTNDKKLKNISGVKTLLLDDLIS